MTPEWRILMLKYPLVPMVILVGNPRAFPSFERVRCEHVEANHLVAFGVGVERCSDRTIMRTFCRECARAWSDKMHIETVECDYCHNHIPKDRVLTWMPSSASPRSDQPMLVCPTCAIESDSLHEDLVYDRALTAKRLGREEYHVDNDS